MFRLLKQMYPQLQLAGKRRIIRARDWILFLKGRQILNQCQQAVKEAEMLIDQIYEKEKERGYEEGVALSRIDMAAEQIRFGQRLQNHFVQVEDDISALVCQLVEKIVGAIPEQQRVIQMIRQSITNLKNQERIKIYVRPEHVDAVYANLQETYRNASVPGALAVEPNPNLIDDQCVIKGGGLMIEMSLKDYMTALHKSFHISETEEVEEEAEAHAG